MTAKSRARARKGHILWVKHLDNRCYRCGDQFTAADLTCDHVYPKRLVGNGSCNYMPCCQPCNLEKGGRLPTRREVNVTACALKRSGRNKFLRMFLQHVFKYGWAADGETCTFS